MESRKSALNYQLSGELEAGLLKNALNFVTSYLNEQDVLTTQILESHNSSGILLQEGGGTQLLLQK